MFNLLLLYSLLMFFIIYILQLRVFKFLVNLDFRILLRVIGYSTLDIISLVYILKFIFEGCTLGN